MSSVTLAAAGPSSSRHSLLNHIKESLNHSAAVSSCRGKLRVHVLYSTPKPARDLYPFAHIDANDASKTNKASRIEAYVEHIIVTAGYTEEDQLQGRLIYALECFLYTLPKHDSALLYVSKLDSSGWGAMPLPKHLVESLIRHRDEEDASWDSSTSIARVITQATISYFASLSHWTGPSIPAIRHVSIHILARAQGAYLFPSSNESGRKHVLSDGGLIKWWRSVLSAVVCGARRRRGKGSESESGIDARPFYVIPGYDQLESRELLPLPPPRSTDHKPDSVLPVGNDALAEAGWVYGHPYSRKGAHSQGPLPPLPLSGPSFETDENDSFNVDSIAELLPHFPDDPKSRFIAELARDSYEHAALPKRKSGTDTPEEGHEKAKRVKREHYATPPPRQNGAEDKAQPVQDSPSKRTDSILQKAMRERRALDAVTPDDFWQRMGFRQECCAGNAVGVFVALFTSTSIPPTDRKAGDEETAGSGKGGIPSQLAALHNPIIPDMILKHLMRDACDWSKPEGSRDLTKAWDEGVERAVKRKGVKQTTTSELVLAESCEGIVFADVALQGPTQSEIDRAQELWEKADGEGSRAASQKVESVAAPINTLSVKRKKKA